MTCPACGAAVPEGARFCPTCGQTMHTRGDERRIVTVLFADLVGFTGLSEALDPEQVKNLVDGCFERLGADITAFGGRIDKIVGDAIVALFGAPIAHEDDAERAVRAALQMHSTLAEVAEQLPISSDAIRLRVGINTGEVLVGALRVGGEYTAMGDVVNVASRLQTLAGPGEVAVGRATHDATASIVRYEPLGAVRARGREEPVEAWIALECVAPPGSRPQRARTPLFGRGPEMGMLDHALAVTVRRRRSHLMLILGEAGVGKSRLAEEVAARARKDHGAIVLEGRCVPYGEANVWWPIADALRRACNVDIGDPSDVSDQKVRAFICDAVSLPEDDDEILRLSEGIAYLMGDEAALHDVDPQRARDEARRSLRVVIEGLARRRPVVLGLSEVHWAHEWVLEGIDRLLERLRNLPLVVVCSARPELETRWAYQPGHRNLVLLHLDPLDPVATTELLGNLLEREVSPDVAEILVERSGGNPLFLEELVALLDEDATAVNARDDLGAAQELPATLRGLVSARLDGLTSAERAVLEDASVVGRNGSAEALAALGAARGESDVRGAMQELVSDDLLVLDDADGWEFRSDVIREVAYDTLTKAERARRHSRLANWMAQRAKATDREDEILERLAHHYGCAALLANELGGVPGLPPDLTSRALDAIVRSAERSEERELHEEAAAQLELAIRLLGDDDEARRRRLQLLRAEALTAGWQLAAARSEVAAARAAATEAADEWAMAASLTAEGFIEYTECDYDRAAATLDRAVDAWRQLGDPKGIAAALRRRGQVASVTGNTAAADADLREAVATYRSLGDRRGEAWALWNLAYSAFLSGEMGLTEERLAEAAKAFADIGDRGGEGWVNGLLGFVRFFQGRRAEAEEIAAGTLEHGRELADRWAQAMMLVLLSGVRLWEGRPGEALAPANEARQLFREIGDTERELFALAFISRSLVAAGRVAEGLASAEEAKAIGDTDPTGKLHLDAALAEAGSSLHAGEFQRILAYMRDADSARDGLGHGAFVAWYAEALLQAGQAGAAVDHLELALTQELPPGQEANIHALLALARATEGHSELAEKSAADVEAMREATYFDRMLARLARGFAAAQRREATDAEEAFASACREADRTGDVFAQAIARLAHGRALEGSGSGKAAGILLEARSRLAEMGSMAPGWDTVFQQAAVAGREPASD